LGSDWGRNRGGRRTRLSIRGRSGGRSRRGLRRRREREIETSEPSFVASLDSRISCLQDDLLDPLEEGILDSLPCSRVSFRIGHGSSIKGIEDAPPSSLTDRLNASLKSTNIVSCNKKLSCVGPQERDIEDARDSEAEVLKIGPDLANRHSPDALDIDMGELRAILPNLSRIAREVGDCQNGSFEVLPSQT